MEARLCALIFTLMRSEEWSNYAEPGYTVVERYLGNDFYKLFKCALGQSKTDHHIQYPPDNPTKLDGRLRYAQRV